MRAIKRDRVRTFTHLERTKICVVAGAQLAHGVVASLPPNVRTISRRLPRDDYRCKCTEFAAVTRSQLCDGIAVEVAYVCNGPQNLDTKKAFS